jgi:hypothetical protein
MHQDHSEVLDDTYDHAWQGKFMSLDILRQVVPAVFWVVAQRSPP